MERFMSSLMAQNTLNHGIPESGPAIAPRAEFCGGLDSALAGGLNGAADSGRAEGANGSWHPSRLRAVILLGGTVRYSGFGASIKRSLLDLPIGGDATLLSYWAWEVSQLCWRLGLKTIPVRVVIGRNCFAPQGTPTAPGVQLSVERDPVEFRGTGGVLRDLSLDYNDDDLLLVANANHLGTEPLALLVEHLLAGTGDVRMLAAANQEPSGLMMMRCECLRQIATAGYVDLKEQALPAIADRYSVRVFTAKEAAGNSIRRWNDYLVALRRRHQPPGETGAWAFQEDWQPRFSVIEPGASIDPSAGIHDSVVLSGGRVDAKATIVRSLIGPGGVVQRGQVVVGRLLTGDGEVE